MSRKSFILNELVAAVVLLGSLACAPRGTSVTSSPVPGSRSDVVPSMPWGIVIHGGAGNFAAGMTDSWRVAHQVVLDSAMRAGWNVLNGGGRSIDAVQAVLVILEDSPLFNAGKGAVFTHDGRVELDAALMDGATMKAGSVAGLHHIKNPILLARLVMDSSQHVMMIGDGAEQFAKEHGMAWVPESYFFTQDRWDALQKELEAEKKPGGTALLPGNASEELWRGALKFGTVGAVALDKAGHLAAGTTTGGISNKKYGRVGDSPIVGAGTYASDASCAVSATGTGEFFIRYTVARDICARVELLNTPLRASAEHVVLDELGAVNGEGGVIALDRHGNVAMPFNTTGMMRGWMGPNGQPTILFTH